MDLSQSRLITVLGILLLWLVVSLPLAAQTDPTIRIRVNAGEVVRTMQGGIGVSWHAIETPIWGREANGDPWSGSVWGANPPADDDPAWQ